MARFIWTVELVEEINGLDPDDMTRERLSEIFNCHLNTVYNYEKIIRENLSFLKEAQKYYEDEEGNPKKWVELNKYLCWLICNVKSLHGKLKGRNKRDKIRMHFIAYSQYYTEKKCDYEIEQQLKQERAEKTVEQPEKTGSNKEGRSAVAA
jgi:hypothetical protein